MNSLIPLGAPVKDVAYIQDELIFDDYLRVTRGGYHQFSIQLHVSGADVAVTMLIRPKATQGEPVETVLNSSDPVIDGEAMTLTGILHESDEINFSLSANCTIDRIYVTAAKGA